VFLSLACSLVRRMGFSHAFLQLILIAVTCKILPASLHQFIISHRTAEQLRVAGCRTPTVCTLCKTFILLMHIPALHLHDMGRPASEICRSSALTPGTELLVIARNAVFLQKMFPVSAGFWSLHDVSTLATSAGLRTKARFSEETKIKHSQKI